MDPRNMQLKEIEKLRQLLPVSDAILQHQDRSSVVRICRAYIQLRAYCSARLLSSDELQCSTSLLLQALDFFCFMIDEQGKFMYITETISTHFGYSQFQMLGSNIEEFIHPDDAYRIRNLIHHIQQTPQWENTTFEEPHLQIIRFRCKLPKRFCGLTYAKMKSAAVDLFIRKTTSFNGRPTVTCLASGTILDKGGITELLVPRNQAVLRIHLDFRVVECDSRYCELTGYITGYIVGRTLYQLVHFDEATYIYNAQYEMMMHSSQQGIFPALRFLRYGGGYTLMSGQIVKVKNEEGPALLLILTFYGYVEGGVEDVLQLGV